MKKVLQLLLALLLFSCSPKVIDLSGGKMTNQMKGNYSILQLDSMCIDDKLPPINNWQKLYLIEDETRDKITIYIYSKNNVIYRVEEISNDSVKIIKRVNK